MNSFLADTLSPIGSATSRLGLLVALTLTAVILAKYVCAGKADNKAMTLGNVAVMLAISLAAYFSPAFARVYLLFIAVIAYYTFGKAVMDECKGSMQSSAAYLLKPYETNVSTSTLTNTFMGAPTTYHPQGLAVARSGGVPS